MYTEKQEKGAIRGGRSVRMTIDNGKQRPQGAKEVNESEGRAMVWSEVEHLDELSFRRRGMQLQLELGAKRKRGRRVESGDPKGRSD